MHEDIHHSANAAEDKAHEDCGCGGNGDCEDKKTPSGKARRALLAGAGSLTFVATLGNRRAYATGVQCGPISLLSSPGPSNGAGGTQCGGVGGGATPGFWKTHKGCTLATIALFSGNGLNATLASGLPCIAGTSIGGTSFQSALCGNGDPYHLSNAILCAWSPGINPQYGYTSGGLNTAVQNALNQNISLSTIIGALTTLENDQGVNTSGCAGGLANHIC
jgi:hypothetical protein